MAHALARDKPVITLEKGRMRCWKRVRRCEIRTDCLPNRR